MSSAIRHGAHWLPAGTAPGRWVGFPRRWAGRSAVRLHGARGGGRLREPVASLTREGRASERARGARAPARADTVARRRARRPRLPLPERSAQVRMAAAVSGSRSPLRAPGPCCRLRTRLGAGTRVATATADSAFWEARAGRLPSPHPLEWVGSGGASPPRSTGLCGVAVREEGRRGAVLLPHPHACTLLRSHAPAWWGWRRERLRLLRRTCCHPFSSPCGGGARGACGGRRWGPGQRGAAPPPRFSGWSARGRPLYPPFLLLLPAGWEPEGGSAEFAVSCPSSFPSTTSLRCTGRRAAPLTGALPPLHLPSALALCRPAELAAAGAYLLLPA